MKPARIRRLFVAGTAGSRGLTDTDLLAVLIEAVARSHRAGTVASLIAEEARRRHAAGEDGAALDLGQLAHQVLEADRRRNDRLPEEEIQREYAELARERAELRRLAQKSIRELEAVQRHDGEAPSTAALLLELKGAVN